jgi:uncharacterized membrane protein YbhN (UPF0104 family)
MKNKIKVAIKIAFIIAAFFIIFHKIDINQLKSIKIQNPFFLFLAFLFFNASQIISALRVHYYLKMIEVKPIFKKQLMLYYVGMFYNMLLPGGIGGDAYKAYKFEQKYQKGYKKIIKALLIDRVSGLFAIFILLSILLTFSSFNFYLKFTFLAVPVFVIILFLIHNHFFKEFKNITFKNLFLSIIIQLLQLLSFISILLSLGENNHIIDFSILFFISSLLSVIPVSIGGVGLRELTFLYGLEILGLNPAKGIVAAFLFFVITLISSAIGMLFLKGVKDV